MVWCSPIGDRKFARLNKPLAFGILYGLVVSISKDDLGMKKLFARWVPRLLTIDNKRDRVIISKEPGTRITFCFFL